MALRVLVADPVESMLCACLGQRARVRHRVATTPVGLLQERRLETVKEQDDDDGEEAGQQRDDLQAGQGRVRDDLETGQGRVRDDSVVCSTAGIRSCSHRADIIAADRSHLKQAQTVSDEWRLIIVRHLQ